VIRFYLVLSIFFSFPFLWLAAAFTSLTWLAVAAGVAFLGILWFQSFAFSKTLKSRHAISLTDEWMSEVLNRITLSLYRELGKKKPHFRFWRFSESQAECMVWLKGSEIHVFLSQGLLAQATEPELAALLRKIIHEDLKKIRSENRLYALSLWWDELKGQPNRFRYWFASFWLYPLERLLKIAKI